MSVIDSLMNYLSQYNSGMQTLSNSAYNNLLGMINQSGSQNTFNKHDQPTVSGRETRLSNQQASQNNLALLNALIGQGYGQVSGGVNLGSLLPYLMEMDPEYQSALRWNDFEKERMARVIAGYDKGDTCVGGSAIMQGSTPGATGEIIGSPNFPSFSSGWGGTTWDNAFDIAEKYGTRQKQMAQSQSYWPATKVKNSAKYNIGKYGKKGAKQLGY